MSYLKVTQLNLNNRELKVSNNVGVEHQVTSMCTCKEQVGKSVECELMIGYTHKFYEIEK